VSPVRRRFVEKGEDRGGIDWIPSMQRGLTHRFDKKGSAETGVGDFA